VPVGVCVSVCVSAALRIVSPRLHAALVSAAKVMRCIQCCVVVAVVVVVVVVVVVHTGCEREWQVE